jgi:hypothetical protein
VDVVVDVVADVGVGDDVLGVLTVQPATDSDATIKRTIAAAKVFLISFAFATNK